MNASADTMRACKRCGEYKSLTSFPIQKRMALGRGNTCNACCYIRWRQLRERSNGSDVDLGARKTCTECGESKAIDEFHASKGGMYERRGKCKDCSARGSAARRKKWRSVPESREQDRLTRRKYNLVRKYGITHERYQEMWHAQGGLCAICGNPESAVKVRSQEKKWLSVDHDHVTGKIRELLCSSCNGGMGQLGDSIDLLRKVIAYLERHSAATP